MQVGRWGNSLAVRLPASIVDALRLKEGDEVDIEVVDASPPRLRLSLQQKREAALASLRALARPFPPDFKFDRNEASERGG
jgi:antitoxin MazE